MPNSVVDLLRIETACLEDIGGREDQQDQVIVLKGGDAEGADAEDADAKGDGAQLLALADGMGGHAGGALAAQAVMDAAADEFHALGGVSVGDREGLLTRILARAHERINALGAERGLKPHSTCVLLHIDGAAAAWAHVGDSRLHRFADGRFIERTLDHSIVELMRMQGRITEEEMKTHPDKNRLHEALGGERLPQMEVDGKESAAGDGYLLASDGVWENVANADLEAVLQAEDLAEALRRLIDRAKAHGGPECDNLSAAVARCRAGAHPIS